MLLKTQSVSNEISHKSHQKPSHASIRFYFGDIHTKLKISEPDDPLEREADIIAEKVMRMNYVQNDTKSDSQGKEKEMVNLNCSKCEEQEDYVRQPVQISSKNNNMKDVALSNEVKNIIDEGKALDRPTRDFMESRFGYEFSNVKIHTGDMAAEIG